MEEPYVLLFAAGWLISLICTGSLIHEAKKTGNTAARRVNRIILGIAIALLAAQVVFYVNFVLNFRIVF